MTNRNWLVGLVLAFLVGGAIGAAVGGYRGFRSGMSAILNEALRRDAREVAAAVVILRHLKAGENGQAAQKLEAGLSDALITFDPDQPYADLEDPTVSALRDAIAQAKEYRSAYPRPPEDMRDRMVQSLFARDLYK